MKVSSYPKFIDDRDDRDPPNVWKSHTVGVMARDTFMSGWGWAEGLNSYAVWLCEPKHYDSVMDWVRRRGEMKNVRRILSENVTAKIMRQRVTAGGLVHVYVVKDGDPSTGTTR